MKYRNVQYPVRMSLLLCLFFMWNYAAAAKLKQYVHNFEYVYNTYKNKRNNRQSDL